MDLLKNNSHEGRVVLGLDEDGGVCPFPTTSFFLLSLDYDHVTFDFILRETFQLKKRFGIKFVIYQSSPNHFHIRSPTPLAKEKALEIMKMSKCSQDYKNFVLKGGNFVIREGEKIQYHDGVETDRKPPPQQVFRI